MALNLRAIALCAVVALLAGCSGAGSPSTTGAGFGAGPGAVKTLFQGTRGFIVRGQRAVHKDRSKSWRSPQLQKNISGHLLFISDSGTDDVYIYELPAFTLMAVLTGFNLPQGMCSDSSGDVWLTNTWSFQIIEFNHSGNVINTLNDATGWPVGCAWDPTTHNLAVTNIVDFSNGTTGAQEPGAVLVYPGATGTPTAYQDADMYNYYSVAYQPNGKLFFDGFRDYTNTTFGLDELPTNANLPDIVNVSGGTIHSPAGLQWHQGLLVGDQECGGSYSPETSCVDHVAISHLSGSITGSTTLEDWSGYPACDVVQAVLGGQSLYGGDFEYPPLTGYSYDFSCSDPSPASAAYRWTYPGGSPQRQNASPYSASSVPNGTAISL